MITGKDLQKWGLPAGPVFKEALKFFQEYSHTHKDAEKVIMAIVANPEEWARGAYAPIADVLIDKEPPAPVIRDMGGL